VDALEWSRFAPKGFAWRLSGPTLRQQDLTKIYSLPIDLLTPFPQIRIISNAGKQCWERGMKHNIGNFRASLLGAALAVTIIASGCANAAREEMVTLHTTPAAADPTWTRPARNRELRIFVVVKINKAARDKFVADIQDPKSPNYLHGLPRGKAGAEEHRRRFWPPPDKIKALTDWLSSQGFEVQEPEMSGLTAIGTVEAADKAFATTIVESPDGYQYANKTEPQIPARFADVVEAIGGLDNLSGAVPVSRKP
jgi:hypothetical protein